MKIKGRPNLKVFKEMMDADHNGSCDRSNKSWMNSNQNSSWVNREYEIESGNCVNECVSMCVSVLYNIILTYHYHYYHHYHHHHDQLESLMIHYTVSTV